MSYAMSNPQIAFLLNKAIEGIKSGRLDSGKLYLNQILKLSPSHDEALRFLGVIEALKGNYQGAEILLRQAIKANQKNGIAYSNLGNVIKKLGRRDEALDYYNKAIILNAGYGEAYRNRGILLNEIGGHERASNDFLTAIKLEGSSESYFAYANFLREQKNYKESLIYYQKAITLSPNYPEVHENLGHLLLANLNFRAGWDHYNFRWLTGEFDSPILKTSKSKWTGSKSSSSLFVWSEQGIGDQILYSSMLHDLAQLPQKKIISLDKKLLAIFRRSFPNYEFISKEDPVSEELYDEHIPIGSLGGIFRNNLEDFQRARHPYIMDDVVRTQSIKSRPEFKNKITCGISWGSINKKVGDDKSIPIQDLYPILKISNIKFVNLQYGEVERVLLKVREDTEKEILNINEINLFDDVDGALSIIAACDIVVTSSNSTAHLAGALGKETLLIVPYSVGQFWYWHAIDGMSIWYPSVRVFEQEQQGDWSVPVKAVKHYLESRFG